MCTIIKYYDREMLALFTHAHWINCWDAKEAMGVLFQDSSTKVQMMKDQLKLSLCENSLHISL